MGLYLLGTQSACGKAQRARQGGRLAQLPLTAFSLDQVNHPNAVTLFWLTLAVRASCNSLEGGGCAHHVAASGVQHALGLACACVRVNMHHGQIASMGHLVRGHA